MKRFGSFPLNVGELGVVGRHLRPPPSFLENLLWISGQEIHHSHKGVGSLLPTECLPHSLAWSSRMQGLVQLIMTALVPSDTVFLSHVPPECGPGGYGLSSLLLYTLNFYSSCSHLCCSLISSNKTHFRSHLLCEPFLDSSPLSP